MKGKEKDDVGRTSCEDRDEFSPIGSSGDDARSKKTDDPVCTGSLVQRTSRAGVAGGDASNAREALEDDMSEMRRKDVMSHGRGTESPFDPLVDMDRDGRKAVDDTRVARMGVEARDGVETMRRMQERGGKDTVVTLFVSTQLCLRCSTAQRNFPARLEHPTRNSCVPFRVLVLLSPPWLCLESSTELSAVVSLGFDIEGLSLPFSSFSLSLPRLLTVRLQAQPSCGLSCGFSDPGSRTCSVLIFRRKSAADFHRSTPLTQTDTSSHPRPSILFVRCPKLS